jgi:S1-C subfamily serine protease
MDREHPAGAPEGEGAAGAAPQSPTGTDTESEAPAGTEAESRPDQPLPQPERDAESGPDEPLPQPEPEPAPSWAWSTSTDAQPIVPPPVPESTERPRSRSGVRAALVGGVAGALVGALIAGGLVVAFDDDPESQRLRTTPATEDDSARPAQTIVTPGEIGSILDATRPAVVRIDVGGAAGAEGTGTGFIVDPSGVIVTNAHVVNGFDNVTVHLANGDELEGDVLGVDESHDIAVVQVDGENLPTLELGDSDALQVGDSVVAIGNALGLSAGSGATVTTGIVSGLDRVVDVGTETLFNAIQTDAAINPGNSGGPLVDASGKVVGINTAIASPDTANNVGFAISISSAKPVIDALRAGETPQTAFLGVTTEPVTPSVADDVGVDHGAIVVEVSPDSAAADAGLEEGDVIIEIAGREVDDVADVASEVRRHRPGDEIDVVIMRDGQEQTLRATLGERPEDS